MKFEISVLPEIVKYCLSSVQKDEKSAYKNIVRGLRENMHIDNFQNSNTVENMLAWLFYLNYLFNY